MSEKVAMTIEVVKRVELNKEDVDFIVVGALEGSVNHWVDKLGDVCVSGRQLRKSKPDDMAISEWVTELLFMGESVILHYGEEEDDPQVVGLDIVKLRRGIKMNMEEHGNTDTGAYDADDYDRVFQYACFGEIVYG